MTDHRYKVKETMKSHESTFDGKPVDVRFSKLNQADYTVISVLEQGSGNIIATPSVYLSKAKRAHDEVFLRNVPSGIVEFLANEDLITIGDQLVETNHNDYAQVCRLTDKAKELIV